MALKIRLRHQGRRNRPFFRLVVADERSPRDGRYLESLGWYSPVEKDESKALLFNEERIQHWLGLGAQLTGNAEALVKRSVPAIKQWLMERELTRRARIATKRKERKKELAKK